MKNVEELKLDLTIGRRGADCAKITKDTFGVSQAQFNRAIDGLEEVPGFVLIKSCIADGDNSIELEDCEFESDQHVVNFIADVSEGWNIIVSKMIAIDAMLSIGEDEKRKVEIRYNGESKLGYIFTNVFKIASAIIDIADSEFNGESEKELSKRHGKLEMTIASDALKYGKEKAVEFAGAVISHDADDGVPDNVYK